MFAFVYTIEHAIPPSDVSNFFLSPPIHPVIGIPPICSRKKTLLPIETKLREIMSGNGILKIDGVQYQTAVAELQDLGTLGNGTCGHVVKMRHPTTDTTIAVKQMRRTGNIEENNRIIMDIDVVLKSHDCPYIVQCLGYFITECDVWVCMELMKTCFDKLLKRLTQPVPESIMGKITVAVRQRNLRLKNGGLTALTNVCFFFCRPFERCPT